MGGYTYELPNGNVVYRASSIGYCPLALYYDRQGVDHEPTPEWLQKAFDEGIDNEQRILDMLYSKTPLWKLYTVEELKNRGYQMGDVTGDPSGNDYSSQVRVEIPVGNVGVVRGHVDGVAYIWLSGHKRYWETRGVEAKAFGNSLWGLYKRKGLAGFPKYQWQVSVLMHGLGLPFLFVVGRKDDAGVVQEIDIEEVDEPPVSLGQIKGRVLGLEARLGSGNEPKCDIPFMYPCPFYQLHEQEAGLEQGVDDVKLILLDSLADEYERHGRVAKEHNAKKREVGAAIQAFFDEEFGTVEITAETAGDDRPKRSMLLSRNRVTDVQYWQDGEVDPELLAKDGIEVDKYRKPGGTVRYPKVTPQKQSGKADDTEATDNS